MRNNKKPTGGEYFKDYYDSNNQKQFNFNDQRNQELPAFSKNSSFDPFYNNTLKSKHKSQDQKTFNNKRNNENYSNNLLFKSSNNQFNEIGGFNLNRNPNQNQFTDLNQHSSNKMYRNYQDEEFNQKNNFYNRNHNNNNYNYNYYNNNHQFKNFYNCKRNNQKNDNYNKKEKNIIDNNNKLIENPQVNILQNNKTDKNFNTNNNNKNSENDFALNCKLNFSIKSEEKLIDNFSVNNSIQGDSFNSVEEKNEFKNDDQCIFTEKNYIEDNTKTNTNSNTPVSASPILACHKKSIISIKNEIKLNDSKDYIDKSSNENLETNLINQEKKEEQSFKENEKNNFKNYESLHSDVMQKHVIENMQIYNLNVNEDKKIFDTQNKFNSNYVVDPLNNSSTNVKINENINNNYSRSNQAKNYTSSNKNKNSDSFFKNKFSQNSNNNVTNYNHVAPVVDSFSHADPRFLNNNFNHNARLFDYNLFPPKNYFPLFPNNPSMIMQNNNIQYPNQNQFLSFSGNFLNRNLETMNSMNPSHPGFHFNNNFNNNNFLHNNHFIQNDNAFTFNNQSEFIPFHLNNNKNIFYNNNNEPFKSNLQNNQNLNFFNSDNNLNNSSNYFNENLNKPIMNNNNINNENYSNSSYNKKNSNINSNFPQKSISENPVFESNPNSAVVNNYFNYMFNDANANNPIIENGKKSDEIISELNVVLQKSTVEKKNESSFAEKVEIKAAKINNVSTADFLENKFRTKSNIFLKNDEKLDSNDNQEITKKQNQNIAKELKENSIPKLNSNEKENEKTNKSQRSTQTKIFNQNKNFLNEKNSSRAITENFRTNSNENVEILKVVLMNVPGINTNNNSNSLTFTIHKLENLFDSFKIFLTLNKISAEFEFSILVNIFQAISTIYSLNNSKVTKSDEKSIKILHSIWKNHCFLVSQKSLFNKQNENSFTKKNLENDFDKILNLNENKDLIINEFSNNDSTFPNNKIEKNLIENIGVINSSFSQEESFENIEEELELDISRSFSCKGQYDCIDSMHYMKSISLLNKSF